MATSPREVGNIYVVAEQQRRRLQALDAQTLRQLTETYGRIYSDLRVRLDLLVQEAVAAGIRTPAQLWKLQRARDLIEQLRERLSTFEVYAGETIATAQLSSANAAVTDVERQLTLLLRQANVPANLRAVFNRVPVEALDFSIGSLADGTPLRQYFLERGFAEQTINAIRDTLASGLVNGWGPEQVAREFRRSLGMELTRALTTARTEVMRAYREASRLNYLNNGITEWEWIATLSTRTCAACIALDGRTFPIDEPMNDHPNGRCTALPVIPGVTDQIPRIRRTEFGTFEGTGQQWFEQLPEGTQRQMLGPHKHKALVDGQIQLDDLIAQSTSPTFGTHFFEASLAHATGS